MRFVQLCKFNCKVIVIFENGAFKHPAVRAVLNPVQTRKLKLIRDFASNAPVLSDAFKEDTTLKEVIAASKGETTAAVKDKTLTPSSPVAVSRPTEEEDTRVP